MGMSTIAVHPRVVIGARAQRATWRVRPLAEVRQLHEVRELREVRRLRESRLRGEVLPLGEGRSSGEAIPLGEGRPSGEAIPLSAGRRLGGVGSRGEGNAVMPEAHGDAPLRLTRRGRVVVVALALLLAVAGVMGGRAVADGPARATEVRTYSVQSGETMWGIAADIAAPGEDVRDVVLQLQRLNGLSDGSLAAGQVLLLPADS